MNPQLARAQLLLQQGRHSLAEAELRLALGGEPQNPLAHALLALALSAQKKYEPALEAARQAVALAPDAGVSFYALAVVLFQRDAHADQHQVLLSLGRKLYQEAEQAITEAVRLNPNDADYFGLLAGIRLARRDWPGALEAASQGLEADPLHVTCANCRAEALVKLGRRAEAGEALDAALAEDPEDDFTHANKGWALLHAGQPRPALDHFKEALRLNPENDYARHGIIEALKARNFLYRWMLAYFLWMSRLSAGMQWGILLGGYFLIRLLGAASRKNPEITPFVFPIQILYVIFCVLSWTAPHLFNLLLRLDRFGKYALSEDQVKGANWVGACLFGGLGLLLAGALLNSSLLALAGLGGVALMIPIGGTFSRAGRARRGLAIYTAALALVGAAGLALLACKSPLAGTFGGLFALGLLFFTLAANLMSSR